MKTLLPIFIITILFSIYTFAQRETKTGGKGQESGRIERIKRNQNNNRIIDKHPGTINRQQNLIQETVLIESEDIVFIEPQQHGYCIVNHPAKYSFPDRIYQIPNIEFILQKFSEEDFEWIIVYLSESIEENPFVPELHYLRGVAYLDRKSDFKKPDYWAAENDFFTVKTLDPNFPGLIYYLEILDFYLLGKKRKQPITTR